MTEWELALVRLVALHVRLMSLEQAARFAWRGQRGALRRATEAVRALEHARWLRVRSVLARPAPRLAGPLVVWRPGDATPATRPLARRLHRRASRASARETTVIVAGPRARATLAGLGGAPRLKLAQVTHDLSVASVLLAYLDAGLPVDRWVGEDRLPKQWPLRERPDALLVSERGDCQRAVEYGGDYTAPRLEALHAALASLPLAYDLW